LDYRTRLVNQSFQSSHKKLHYVEQFPQSGYFARKTSFPCFMAYTTFTAIFVAFFVEEAKIYSTFKMFYFITLLLRYFSGGHGDNKAELFEPGHFVGLGLILKSEIRTRA
jgi:hypothetical protein